MSLEISDLDISQSRRPYLPITPLAGTSSIPFHSRERSQLVDGRLTARPTGDFSTITAHDSLIRLASQLQSQYGYGPGRLDGSHRSNRLPQSNSTGMPMPLIPHRLAKQEATDPPPLLATASNPPRLSSYAQGVSYANPPVQVETAAASYSSQIQSRVASDKTVSAHGAHAGATGPRIRTTADPSPVESITLLPAISASASILRLGYHPQSSHLTLPSSANKLWFGREEGSSTRTIDEWQREGEVSQHVLRGLRVSPPFVDDSLDGSDRSVSLDITALGIVGGMSRARTPSGRGYSDLPLDSPLAIHLGSRSFVSWKHRRRIHRPKSSAAFLRKFVYSADQQRASERKAAANAAHSEQPIFDRLSVVLAGKARGSDNKGASALPARSAKLSITQQKSHASPVLVPETYTALRRASLTFAAIEVDARLDLGAASLLAEDSGVTRGRIRVRSSNGVSVGGARVLLDDGTCIPSLVLKLKHYLRSTDRRNPVEGAEARWSSATMLHIVHVKRRVMSRFRHRIATRQASSVIANRTGIWTMRRAWHAWQSASAVVHDRELAVEGAQLRGKKHVLASSFLGWKDATMRSLDLRMRVGAFQAHRLSYHLSMWRAAVLYGKSARELRTWIAKRTAVRAVRAIRQAIQLAGEKEKVAQAHARQLILARCGRLLFAWKSSSQALTRLADEFVLRTIIPSRLTAAVRQWHQVAAAASRQRVEDSRKRSIVQTVKVSYALHAWRTWRGSNVRERARAERADVLHATHAVRHAQWILHRWRRNMRAQGKQDDTGVNAIERKRKTRYCHSAFRHFVRVFDCHNRRRMAAGQVLQRMVQQHAQSLAFKALAAHVSDEVERDAHLDELLTSFWSSRIHLQAVRSVRRWCVDAREGLRMRMRMRKARAHYMFNLYLRAFSGWRGYASRMTQLNNAEVMIRGQQVRRKLHFVLRAWRDRAARMYRMREARLAFARMWHRLRAGIILARWKVYVRTTQSARNSLHSVVCKSCERQLRHSWHAWRAGLAGQAKHAARVSAAEAMQRRHLMTRFLCAWRGLAADEGRLKRASRFAQAACIKTTKKRVFNNWVREVRVLMLEREMDDVAVSHHCVYAARHFLFHMRLHAGMQREWRAMEAAHTQRCCARGLRAWREWRQDRLLLRAQSRLADAHAFSAFCSRSWQALQRCLRVQHERIEAARLFLLGQDSLKRRSILNRWASIVQTRVASRKAGACTLLRLSRVRSMRAGLRAWFSALDVLRTEAAQREQDVRGQMSLAKVQAEALLKRVEELKDAEQKAKETTAAALVFAQEEATRSVKAELVEQQSRHMAEESAAAVLALEQAEHLALHAARVDTALRLSARMKLRLALHTWLDRVETVKYRNMQVQQAEDVFYHSTARRVLLSWQDAAAERQWTRAAVLQLQQATMARVMQRMRLYARRKAAVRKQVQYMRMALVDGPERTYLWATTLISTLPYVEELTDRASVDRSRLHAAWLLLTAAVRTSQRIRALWTCFRTAVQDDLTLYGWLEHSGALRRWRVWSAGRRAAAALDVLALKLSERKAVGRTGGYLRKWKAWAQEREGERAMNAYAGEFCQRKLATLSLAMWQRQVSRTQRRAELLSRALAFYHVALQRRAWRTWKELEPGDWPVEEVYTGASGFDAVRRPIQVQLMIADLEDAPVRDAEAVAAEDRLEEVVRGRALPSKLRAAVDAETEPEGAF